MSSRPPRLPQPERAQAVPRSPAVSFAAVIDALPLRRNAARQALERWRWMAFPLLLFIFSRAALLGFSQLSLMLVPQLNWEFASRVFLKPYPALDGLCRWDCWHFARIASEGYTEARWTNFFPLYPFLSRFVSVVTTVDINLALLIVSNVASLGTFLLIYRVFTLLADADVARVSLVLFAAYPFAFFQATGYPESLMLFFSALAILLALRGHHIWAGVALGFGVLSRHITMFVGASLLAAQIRERGVNPRRLLFHPAILGLIIPWLFLGAYSLYQYQVFGNPLAFSAARDQPPWSELAWWGIDDLLATTSRSDHVQAMYSYLPFALLTTIGSLALLAKRQWLELAAFAIIFMVVMWSIGMWGLGRYTASCWPAFLPLGAWLAKHPAWQAPVVAGLALFQGLFFYLFIHMYAIL